MKQPLITYREICERAKALTPVSTSVFSSPLSRDFVGSETTYLLSQGCRIVKDGGVRSSSRMNLGGYLADLNLNEALNLSLFPTQQVDLINLASAYSAQPEMLPYVGTEKQYAPSRHRRSVISAVLKVVVAHTCFYTWRIGRYTRRGFEEISLVEMARLAGFTYWRNGVERIERCFSRAYDQFAAGYIYSHQSRGRTTRSSSGWKRASRYVSRRLFEHIMNCFPSAVSQHSFDDLVKAAKARFTKKDGATRGERLKKMGALSKIKNLCNSEFENLIKTLRVLGFSSSTARDAAIVRFADLVSFITPPSYGPPVTR